MQTDEMLSWRDANLEFQKLSELLQAKLSISLVLLPTTIKRVEARVGGICFMTSVILNLLNSPEASVFSRKTRLGPT